MGFRAAVDRESLVAVYPNAVSGQWNDGRPTWPPHGPAGRVDDVAFTSQAGRDISFPPAFPIQHASTWPGIPTAA